MLAAERQEAAPGRIPVRLLFTTGPDWYQAAIRLTTLSPASHAAVAIGEHGEQILHAIEKGVRLEPRSDWLIKEKQRVVAEYLVQPDVSDGVRNMLAHVGERYDLPGVVRIGLIRMFNLFGSPVHYFGPMSNIAHTCARFVMLLDPLGHRIPEWRHIDRESVTPSDLLRAAEGGPSFLRIR